MACCSVCTRLVEILGSDPVSHDDDRYGANLTHSPYVQCEHTSEDTPHSSRNILDIVLCVTIYSSNPIEIVGRELKLNVSLLFKDVFKVSRASTKYVQEH